MNNLQHFALGLRGRLILLLMTASASLSGLVGWDIVRDLDRLRRSPPIDGDRNALAATEQ